MAGNRYDPSVTINDLSESDSDDPDKFSIGALSSITTNELTDSNSSDDTYEYSLVDIQPEFWNPVIAGSSPVEYDSGNSDDLEGSPDGGAGGGRHRVSDRGNADNNVGFEGDWHKSARIGDLVRSLCLGDRIEFDRVQYSHWGIYVGEYGEIEHAVIHFGMFEGGKEYAKKKVLGRASKAPTGKSPAIRADTIEKILGDGKMRINNSRDKKSKPLSPGTIIEIAKTKLQDKTPTDYSLLSSNCEHFVNLCRYIQHHSDQASAKLKTLEKALVSIFKGSSGSARRRRDASQP